MKAMTWILIVTLIFQIVLHPVVRAQEQRQETKRIALVDFRNLTGDPALDRYKKSIPDQIQTVLAGLGTLRLVERGQLESALEELKLGMDAIVDDQTAVRLGRILNANAIITGSYYREGNLFQFTARVIEVETSEVITGVVERSRPGEDVFNAIDRLAEGIIEKLRLHEWSDVIFQPPPEITEQPKKGKKLLLWVALGVAAVAGGTLVLVTGGGGDGETTEPSILADPPPRPGNR